MMMQDDDMPAIGRRIKKVRQRLKLQQREFAKSLGTAHSYISKIETGNANPGPSLFLRLSKEFNVSIEYLFSGSGDMFRKQTKINADKLEHIDLANDLQSMEDLVWLMEHSPFVKNTVLGFGLKFAAENESLIKNSILKNLTSFTSDKKNIKKAVTVRRSVEVLWKIDRIGSTGRRGDFNS